MITSQTRIRPLFSRRLKHVPYKLSTCFRSKIVLIFSWNYMKVLVKYLCNKIKNVLLTKQPICSVSISILSSTKRLTQMKQISKHMAESPKTMCAGICVYAKVKIPIIHPSKSAACIRAILLRKNKTK